MDEENKKPLEEQEDTIDENQIKLFDDSETEKWRDEWQNMPEFVQENQEPFQSVIVHFETKQDRNNFAKLIDQNITYRTPSIWFPKANIRVAKDKRYIDSK